MAIIKLVVKCNKCGNETIMGPEFLKTVSTLKLKTIDNFKCDKCNHNNVKE